MTNSAEIINFPEHESTNTKEQGHYLKADVKDGFMQIANALQDFLCKVELSGRQHQVLNSIIRKTYGFNKKLDWIAGEQLKEQMKYKGAVTHLHADVRELEKRHIIISDGRKIGPNPILSEWTLNKPKTVTKATNRKRSLDKPKTV